jgi:hypothetical protein
MLNTNQFVIKIFLFETNLFNHTSLSHRKWQKIKVLTP